ncbi:MAG TPA: DUF1439 domain-containing protein, partial [Usitatibacteraceae bacterium]|nr:DUF1439 domain-containing protein [Usitatibacteraceae bacterium]
MKTLHRWFTVLFITVSGCTWLPLLSGEISMGAEELAARMARRFPVERSMAGLLEARLENPRVTLNEAAMRIGAEFDLTVKLALSNKPLYGRLRISGRPDYDPASRALFLREAAVDEIRFESMGEALSGALTKSASALARDVVESKPLYVFTQQEIEKKGFGREPERIF